MARSPPERGISDVVARARLSASPLAVGLIRPRAAGGSGADLETVGR